MEEGTGYLRGLQKVVRAGRDQVRKDKTQTEFNLARDIKENKKKGQGGGGLSQEGNWRCGHGGYGES